MGGREEEREKKGRKKRREGGEWEVEGERQKLSQDNPRVISGDI